MKKTILLALCLVLIGAGAAMAAPYNITNYTQTQQWTTTTAGSWTAPGVSIPPNSEFTTYGANFNTNTGDFTLFTNWAPSDVGNFYNSYVGTAFFFIDKDVLTNKGWDYAIDLNGQKIYTSLAITNSEDAGLESGGTIKFGNNASIGYGRYYGGSGTALIPVLATGTDKDLTVTWDFTNSIHTATMNLTGVVSADEWAFLWGTATCANGTFTGSADGMVPVPPSVLLMGTGLSGLGGPRGGAAAGRHPEPSLSPGIKFPGG